jgi:hypothetical protein
MLWSEEIPAYAGRFFRSNDQYSPIIPQYPRADKCAQKRTGEPLGKMKANRFYQLVNHEYSPLNTTLPAAICGIQLLPSIG